MKMLKALVLLSLVITFSDGKETRFSDEHRVHLKDGWLHVYSKEQGEKPILFVNSAYLRSFGYGPDDLK